MPRYARFASASGPCWARVTDVGLVPLRGSPLGGEPPREIGEPQPLATIALLPPTPATKIICVGRNYRTHAEELGFDVPSEPLLFLKPPSALVAHGEPIVYPTGESELVHHEGELALVVGRRVRHAAEAEVLHRDSGILWGCTILNDVTARDLQRRDVQFTRAKGFDSFAPCGPWVDTDFWPRDQALTVRVNGEIRQEGRLDQMVFGVGALVAAISRIMTLEPGDLIATGTPSGVGVLRPGDTVDVCIEGLGTLSNPVVAGS